MKVFLQISDGRWYSRVNSLDREFQITHLWYLRFRKYETMVSEKYVYLSVPKHNHVRISFTSQLKESLIYLLFLLSNIFETLLRRIPYEMCLKVRNTQNFEKVKKKLWQRLYIKKIFLWNDVQYLSGLPTEKKFFSIGIF